MQIVFLGTSGSWPTPKRNVSAVAVKRGPEVLLFDCGEGTQRQFMLSKLSFMQVTRVFLTHFHGDHFLGLPGMIQSMSMNGREAPLQVFGPAGVERLAAGRPRRQGGGGPTARAHAPQSPLRGSVDAPRGREGRVRTRPGRGGLHGDRGALPGLTVTGASSGPISSR